MPSGTVDWVLERAAALPRVPSLAFVHIPLPQFRELWNSQPTLGSKGEAVACPLRDTGVFEAFRQALRPAASLLDSALRVWPALRFTGPCNG